MTHYSNSGDYDIPDNVFQLAYRGYALQHGDSQTIEVIKRRGGFSIQEIIRDISYLLSYIDKQVIDKVKDIAKKEVKKT